MQQERMQQKDKKVGAEQVGVDDDEHDCTGGRDDAGLYAPLRSIGYMPCIVAEDRKDKASDGQGCPTYQTQTNSMG